MIHPIQVFIGYDERQPVAFNVLAHSIQRRASSEVSIRPLKLKNLPMTRRGLTEFTYTRFLVPWLCDFIGMGIFIDSDFLCLGDIAELAKIAEELVTGSIETDVLVVKNKLKFEWASMMIFRNFSCRQLQPKYVEDEKNALFDFAWARRVKGLPAKWNHLVGYDKPDPTAALIHYTQGIPCWPETADCEFAQEWRAEAKDMTSTVSWFELMGNSVHAKPVLKRLKKAAS